MAAFKQAHKDESIGRGRMFVKDPVKKDFAMITRFGCSVGNTKATRMAEMT